jgi:outer membrane receptor protein involved in Fe transport
MNLLLPSITSYFRKSFCLTLMSLLFIVPVFGQQVQLKGKVSTANQEPVAYATVSILQKSDSTLVKVSITDGDGKFSFAEIKAGEYLLRVTSVGYKEYIQEIKQNTDFQIAMEEDSQVLSEIQVTARKPIIEILADKTVFNVEGTLSASGITGFDLLRKAPGVVIDNNENLIVEGKGGVQIYIDGKPSPLTGQDLANYLKTLQSSDVEAIEIITQPSSKYDAAGTAGIVNIRLKKNKNFGTNGTLTAGYAIGRFSKYNTGISLNNRNKKVNLYSNYSNQLSENYDFINLYRVQSNTIFDAQSSSISNDQSHNAKVGLDFYASSKSTFGLILNGNLNNSSSFNDSRTPIISQSTLETQQVLVAQSNSETDSYNFSGNLNYRFADTLGHSLNIDLDYGRYNNDRSNLQPNYYYNGSETTIQDEFIYFMITPVDIQIMSLKLDYEQSFLGGKLGVGFKSSLVDTDNTFEFYDVIDNDNILNDTRSNNFRYKENVNAAYFNFNKKWKKMNVQFGLRAEHTNSDGKLNSLQQNENERVKRNYLNLFPSGGLTYTLNPQNSLALTYSKRIERPNYRSLNPFEVQIDELSFSRGNPFLQPQYTDNIKISHTFKYVLNTSLSYSKISNFTAQVTDAEGENRSVIQAQNIANQEVINLGISCPFDATKWWSVFLSLNASRSSFEAKDERYVAITQNNLSFYGQNNFTLPKGFQFEISGWYSSPSVWGGTYQTKSLGSLDIALQKKFLEDKLSIRLAVSDILFTSPWRGETRFANVYIRGNGGWESRQFRVNLSYLFGNNKMKSARNRNTGIEDENKRTE